MCGALSAACSTALPCCQPYQCKGDVCSESLLPIDMSGTDGATTSAWSVLPSVTTVDLYSVVGQSASNIFVVGGKPGTMTGNPGVIAHYDGTTWSAAPNVVNLVGVSGFGLLFAVGELGGGEGRVIRFDGSGWSTSSVVAPAYLRGVWAPLSSDAQVWAMGDNGTLLKSNGFTSTWATITTSTTETLHAGWGSQLDDTYAVGANGTVLHLKGSPAAWSLSKATSATLRGIWGSSANDVYIVGSDAANTVGTALHSIDGGQSWTPSTSAVPPLFAVWGSSATDIYAVGTGGAIYHSTGNNAWTLDPSPTTQDLLGIWGSSATDVYIVGRGGTILHK